jgi:predicted dienelactone hydrolase
MDRQAYELDSKGPPMRSIPFNLLPVFLLVAALVSRGAAAAETKYDPLEIAGGELPEPIDTIAKDDSRSRDVPLRIYLPAAKEAAPVILFSHGLGGTREGSGYLGKHWAARGYVVVYLQHAGSDDSVWRNKRLGQRLNAMRQAANAQNFMLRVADVKSVLDQLEAWNKADKHELSGRLDLDRVGMTGHSFGAVTTQAVSGQRFDRGAHLTNPRIKAAIAFSPSGPRQGDPDDAFGRVEMPWMLMTGTKDVALVGDTDVESRLSVFPALPAGNKYEVVFDKAEHSAFSDRPLPGDKQKRNPNHHRAILALSTAFWNAWLREDEAAKLWLDGDGPRTVLENKDRWQKK